MSFLLFTSLTACVTYTQTQREHIESLSTEFQEVCDTQNDYERVSSYGCDPHDPDNYDECERSHASDLAEIERRAHGRSLQAIVEARNAHGLTPWHGANWICSSWDDARADSKQRTQPGATIYNGFWY